METTNPAQRLLDLLTTIRNFQPNIETPHALRELLGGESQGNTELLARVGLLMQLPREVQDSVESLPPPIDRDLFLSWVPSVETAFLAVRFGASINTIKEQITGEALVALRFVSDRLSTVFPEETLTPDSLATLAQGVARLREEIIASSLSPDVKEFLLGHLRAIDQAIETYRIRGIKGIRDAVHSAVGAMVSDEEVEKRAAGSPVWERTKQFFKGVAFALSFAANVLKLSEALGPFLLPEATAIFEPTAPQVDPPPAFREGEIFDDLKRTGPVIHD